MGDERGRGGKLEVDPPNTSEPPRHERETVRPKPGEPEAAAGQSETGAQRSAGRPAAASDTNKPVIIAILYLTSLVLGITGLVAFILALVWKSEPGEGWEASHYDYQIMTFLLWLGTTVLGIILIFTIIGALVGIPLLFLAVVWLLVRAIMSLIRALNREPMPNPGTWLA
ncbi:hypothetical protein HFP57_09945 [Parasphingopyxis algicola]|uniref:DUF4870 family protein n=1 Tax=Parasphingopyxis algicola TaxID=2026624 RepID=UPI0015A1D7CB|nr:hypothetical protein [Parasphingopyxis algicola]QLC25311.1 hypothetical protein HFP57_09945 [Parasphingopyxis algicola]